MFWGELAEDEIRKLDARKQELRESDDPVDNITAILTDNGIGEFGLWEEIARPKAEKIFNNVFQRHRGR